MPWPIYTLKTLRIKITMELKLCLVMLERSALQMVFRRREWYINLFCAQIQYRHTNAILTTILFS